MALRLLRIAAAIYIFMRTCPSYGGPVSSNDPSHGELVISNEATSSASSTAGMTTHHRSSTENDPNLDVGGGATNSTPWVSAPDNTPGQDKQQTLRQADGADQQSKKQHIEVPRRRPSKPACVYDLLIDMSQNMIEASRDLHDHYCTEEGLNGWMSNRSMTCEEYSMFTVENLVTFLPDISDPEISPNITDSNEEINRVVTNEVLRGLNSYLFVGINMTILETREVCQGLLDPPQPCKGQDVCCTNCKPHYDPFFCETLPLLTTTQWLTQQLVNELVKTMNSLGIEIEQEGSVGLDPPGELTRKQLRHYTLAGIYNTVQQAESSLYSFNVLCNLD